MSAWNKLTFWGALIEARLPRRDFVAAVILVFGLAAAARADDAATASADGIRAQDQVWLVSTRHICCAGDFAQPAVWQWKAGQWSPSDVAEFHRSADPAVVTVFYIHGNRIDDNEGASGGLTVYQQVIGRYAGAAPVRFVIWSWPATKMCRLIKDVRAKARRSDDEAVLFGRFLAGMERPKEMRVGIIGFSYGARIAGGALHMLGGGTVLGYGLRCGDRPAFHVAFWAAAAHNDWLLPGNCHGQALPLGEKWLNLVNGCDESLRHYQFLEKGRNPPALGYTGLAGRDQLPDDLKSRWEEWEVSRLVGTTHNYHPYYSSAWVAERTAQVVLWK